MADDKKHAPLYIAFDSDVLSHLAEVHNMLNNGYLAPNRFKDEYSRVRASQLLNAYKAIQNDIVRPVITNAVFNETIRIPEVVDMVKQYGYFPNYNMVNMRAKRQEVLKLAEMYCEPFISNGKEFPAAMKMTNNEYAGRLTPSSDAVAMAEATVEVAYLLQLMRKILLKLKKILK